MSEYRLTRAIIDLSNGDTWDEAKLEWALERVYLQDQPGECLCGHFPIKEICVIRNRLNGRNTEVGNVCVKKFLGLPSGKIFDALGRVGSDDTKALNPETIEHASELGWITDWERDFYMDTWRKRVMSPKQEAMRKRINRKVVQNARR